jgi:hypothetical protein
MRITRVKNIGLYDSNHLLADRKSQTKRMRIMDPATQKFDNELYYTMILIGHGDSNLDP